MGADDRHKYVPKLVVSYRCFNPEREGKPLSQQYWYVEFKIRNSLGNPTLLGKMMGIKTRDKRISMFSQKGIAIKNFLYSLAKSYSGRLANGKQSIEDRISYAT